MRTFWRWVGATAVVLAVPATVIGLGHAGWLPLPDPPPYQVKTLADFGANLLFLLGGMLMVGLLTGTAIATQAWLERRRARRIPRR